MRILQLLSTQYLTGPAELCLEDAERLRRAGHDVAFGADTRRPGNFVRHIRERGFALLEDLALCAKPRPSELVRDIARLRSHLREADLAHCRFSHDHNLALAALAGLRPRPALVRTAEIARTLRPGPLRSRALRVCDAVVVSCAEYAQRLEQEHGVSGERIHLVPGRVDASRFQPGDARALRAEWGVGEDEVLFGIVARIKEDRQHALLLRAFARLAARHAGVKLAVIGRGEGLPELRALTSRLALERHVIFAGYRRGSALVQAYQALDAKVWLAEGNDGTCRAVLEAMACGVPVVAGRRGVMADYVRHGRDGLLVEWDEAEIAQALERMVPAAARRAMGQSARERAREYPPERRAQALRRAYAQALAVAGRGAPGLELGG